MKLHNGKEGFYTFKNGEKQGDSNSVDYFSGLMSRYERNFYGKLKQASVVSWCAFKDHWIL